VKRATSSQNATFTLHPSHFTLQPRVPRYQREMLRWLAMRNETSVDEVLTRELEDVACAHAEELAAAVPGLEEAMAWPVEG
jgi:hypothetical protein